MTNVTKLPTGEALTTDQSIVRYILNQMEEVEIIEFEAQLARDPQLKVMLAREIELRDAVNGAFPADQIEAHLNQNADSFSNFRERISEPDSHSVLNENTNQTQINSVNRWWKTSAAVASAATIALFLGMSQLNQTPVAEFEGLSADSVQVNLNPDKFHYNVVFSSQLDTTQRREIVKGLNLEIVSGPNAGNTFLIEALEPLNEQSREELLKHHAIDFLEPVL